MQNNVAACLGKIALVAILIFALMHYQSVAQACQRTGKGDLASQDSHGYGWWRVFNLGLASAYWHAHRTEQLGRSLWKWLHDI